MITKVVISGSGDLSHNESVEAAFRDAYPDFSGTITHLQNSNVSNIITGDYDLIIQSTTGMSSYIAIVAANYPKLVFMPAGSNSFVRIWNNGGVIPCLVVTGAGDIANETGYDVEFISPDTVTIEPDLSSYSNGFIAGQIAKIMNTLNCSFWETRYRARMTASENGTWHATNGYGLIDVDAAIAYTGTIITDPYPSLVIPPDVPEQTPSLLIGTIGNLTAVKNTDAILTWDAVDNATNYKVYKSTDNGVTWTLIYEGALLTYSDSINFGKIQYKYKAEFTNAYSVLETTEYSAVAEINRAYANTIRLI